MTKSNLPTHQVHDVPLEATGFIRPLADVFYAFGPRWVHLERQQILDALQQHQIPLQPALENTAADEEELLWDTLIGHFARQGTHVLLVLQERNRPDSGWICFVPKFKMHALQAILRAFHLPLPENV